MMATVLSSNWKKLEATLKQDLTNSKGLKRKREHTQQQQNSIAKRKRIEAQRTSIAVPSSRKRARMGIWSSTIGQPEEPVSSTSLAFWAEENDISAKDLTEAYGGGLLDTSIQHTPRDQINSGLLSDVEIGKYLAIDCEMVGVGGEEDRSVLARVSVVNFHGSQIYDSFVLPKEFVTDWRTHVSGVSFKNMKTARSFDKVRNEVEVLLKDRILVGHGVKNDLDVLILGHPKRDIRDTSRLREFRKYSAGKTPSLKKLAKEILGIEIQNGQHSSLEDARATMLLFRKHKQAFDAEIATRFIGRATNDVNTRSKPKPKKKRKH